MVKLASGSQGCDGVISGRVDFYGSIGVSGSCIESEGVTSRAEAAEKTVNEPA